MYSIIPKNQPKNPLHSRNKPRFLPPPHQPSIYKHTIHHPSSLTTPSTVPLQHIISLSLQPQKLPPSLSLFHHRINHHYHNHNHHHNHHRPLTILSPTIRIISYRHLILSYTYIGVLCGITATMVGEGGKVSDDEDGGKVIGEE